MPSPIKILISEDTFLLSRELKTFKKKYVPPETADFNFNRFSAKEDSMEACIETCLQYPMMAGRRVVFIRDAEAFKKEALENWIEYFKNPLATTLLVMTASKIDKRLKLWQTAHKKGWICELKAPFANQIPGWITREASEMGLKISYQAAQAMGDLIGTQLMAQVSALEKLALYIYPRKNIEVGDVEAVVGDFLSKTVFDFTSLIGSRNYTSANQLLDQLEKKGEPFVRLLFMIVRHFRLLHLGQEGLMAKWSDGEFAKKMGVHPFFVKEYLAQAKSLSSSRLRQIYQGLLKTDRALKRSPLSSRMVMDRFVMDTCL